MTVEMMAMERALAMVSAGEIQDGKTIVGLMLAAQRLGTVR
jgi:hypothetical protein